MRRRLTAVFLGLSLLTLPACSSSHPHSAPTSTTTAEASSPNPDVVPPVITPAYVNAVFKVLNHVYGNATRVLVATRQVTPAVSSDLRAIFSSPLYEQQVTEAQQSLQGPISNVQATPGDALTVVNRLLSASSSCIFVETQTSLSAVLIKPTPSPTAEYYELDRKDLSSGSSPNPTPWIIGFNVDYVGSEPTPHRCGF